MNNEKAIIGSQHTYFPISIPEKQLNGAQLQLWRDENGDCLVSKIESSGKIHIQRHHLINGLTNQPLNLKHKSKPQQLVYFNFIEKGRLEQ